MKLPTLTTLGLTIAFVACAATPPPTVEKAAGLPPADANGQYSMSWPSLGRGTARFITIELGPDTLEHCRGVSPKFPFDSSTAFVEDKDQLAALVRCLNHESMLSRGVLLVGRADPRGTDAYNLALGSRRAEQIREFLVGEGLAPERIATESEGKRDAKGNLPAYSRGYDWRVDVVVVGGEHQP